MEEKELQSLRNEYEESGHTVRSFAALKDVEFWKMKYALQKGLDLNRESKGEEKPQISRIGFKKVINKDSLQVVTSNHREIIIRTQGGLEIIIPL